MHKLFSSLVFALAASSSASAQQNNDILSVAQSRPDLSTVVNAVQTSPDILDGLRRSTGITVFLPNNNAFNNVNISTNNTNLSNIIRYHILPDSAKNISDFKNYDIQKTLLVPNNLNGQQALLIEKNGGDNNVTINCDRPNNCSRVVDTLSASNGFIHIIDQVLTVPTPIPDTLQSFKKYQLSSLQNALGAAGLMQNLTSSQGITLFAPTNQAFDKVKDVQLSKEQLQEVLKYHVLPTVVYSTDLKEGQMMTLNNASQVNITTNGPKVNQANIIFTDLFAENGVIHVVDGVLVPPSLRQTLPESNAPSSTSSNGAAVTRVASVFTLVLSAAAVVLLM